MQTPYYIDVHYVIKQSRIPFIWLVNYRRADKFTAVNIMDDFGNLVKLDFAAWAVAVANGVH